MRTCPHCNQPAPDTAVGMCPSCGKSLRGTRPTETVEVGLTSPWTGNSTAPLEPGATQDGVELRPGTVLAGRYRIVGLLGVGGMGSVYRAHDQTLDQEVALKFVAEKYANDPSAIALLTNEVKTARQVSHPNVCRVHDIGEIGGRTFISMEYVDGEDLSSLLRRIGRLPGDKAAQIARQLCAGLQAAHERGVLHRDLKPANVMLDGDGNVRITDFGIAAVTDSIRSSDGPSGTPAYMAPELFTGAEASVQSDLYSLGLVLYELFTGRPLFTASSMTELLRHHRKPVRSPADLVPDVDPKVERVILSCLQRDPGQRPRSALAMLAALPGGDPLAEAIASGKTPSPELVAAAGGTGVLSKNAAWLYVASIAAGIALLFALEPHVKLFAQHRLPRSAEVLADRAREWIDDFGYRTDDISFAYGFEVDEPFVDEIKATCPDHEAWQERLSASRPGLLDFWYRQVPHPFRLVANNVKGRVTWDDPSAVQPGSVQLRLDTKGRLRELLAKPAAQGLDRGLGPALGQGSNGSGGVAPRWEVLFDAAELDMSRFEQVKPRRIPHAFADARAAWLGHYPEPPHMPIRIEAAALFGQPVEFHIEEERWPGAPTGRAPRPQKRSWRFLARVGLVIAALVLAYRAIQQRRGDVRGALRLGGVIFALVTGFTVLVGDHEGDWSRIGGLFVAGMMHGMIVAAEFSLYYFAAEPYVRRIWPETMISWSRLLTGRVRDPLVGHHVLIGQTLGVATVLVAYSALLIPRWAGRPEGPPLMLHDSGVEALAGPAAAAGATLEIAVDFARGGMTFFMTLVVLKLLLRRKSLAAIASVLIWATVFTDNATWSSAFPWVPITWLANAGMVALIATFAIRFGLLPLLVGYTLFGTFTSFPLELGAHAWYGEATFLVLAVTAVSTVFGFRTATHPA